MKNNKTKKNNKNILNLFVSYLGNDSNKGSKEYPLKTLEEAKARVNSLIKNNEANIKKININIR